MRLTLRPAELVDEDAVRAAHAAMQDSDGFEFALGLDDDSSFDDFVTRHRLLARGLELPAGFVPATFLLAVVDNLVVGRLSIRHELNDFLAAEGGHIGYGVIEQHRRMGYASETLRQGLVIAHSLGVHQTLLVCDEGNVGSIAVIEGCGGELLNKSTGHDGRAIRRYEIAR